MVNLPFWVSKPSLGFALSAALLPLLCLSYVSASHARIRGDRNDGQLCGRTSDLEPRFDSSEHPGLEVNRESVECGHHYLNPGQSVTIKSKNYPAKHPIKHTCKWSFQGTSCDSNILITCNDFRLQGKEYGCLTLKGGRLKTKSCGRVRRLKMKSDNYKLKAHFVTRGKRGNGFQCTVTALDLCQYTEYCTALDDLEESLNVTKESLQASIQSTDNKVADLQTSLDDTDTTVAGLQTSLQSTDNMVADLQTSLDDTDTTVAGLQSSLQSTDSMVADLQTSLDDTDNTVAGLQTSLQSTDNMVAGLQTSLEDTNNAVGGLETSLEDTNNAVGGLETSLEDTNNAVGGLQTSLEDTNNAVGGLQTSLADTNYAVEVLEESLADTNYMVEDIMEKLQCKQGWKCFQNSCYFFSTTTETWEAGRAACQNMNSDYALISTQAEFEFIDDNIGDTSWVGLNDREVDGTYRWISDGSLITNLQTSWWNNGEPNNLNGDEHCIEIHKNGGMNDHYCGRSIRYVCEVTNRLCF